MRFFFSSRPVLGVLLSVVAIAAIVGGLMGFQVVSSTHLVHTANGPHLLTKLQKRLMSSMALLAHDPTESDLAGTSSPKNYFPTGDDGCSQMRGSNIKVNQNCLNLTDPNLQGRAQANNETSIAVNPMNPKQILASYNDYRRGDGNCYGAYSLTGGKSWNDTTIPMGFTRGTAFGGVAREYWQSGGDTAVAWDTRGNAYFQCQVFQRGPLVTNNPDQSSAFYVFRSTQNAGGSWNFPGRSVIETNTTTGFPFEDKPLMTVDDGLSSPFRDRVYVSWTEFAADGTAYIYESSSKDYGEHFSAPVLVSGNNITLCSNTFGIPTPKGNCNENQFSQPFTGSDGALYVVWANFNNTVTGNDNRNQMLLAKSTDGGVSFSLPVKVADYYDLPDCATYQGGLDFGRACVPEKGSTALSIFRATNYPSGAVNPKNANQVVVTFGSYINVNSKESNGCVPAGLSGSTGLNLYTGVKTPGACNNDILVSVSNNGGASFTGTSTDPRDLTSVTSSGNQGITDQWWQWEAFTSSGKLAVSYYDRQYGNDETTGNSDFNVSSSTNLTTFTAVRATSASMPPPTEFGGVFFGDYTGLAVADNTAYPLWMDTRSVDLFLCPGTGVPGVPPALCKATEPNGLTANDQDAFTAIVNLP